MLVWFINNVNDNIALKMSLTRHSMKANKTTKFSMITALLANNK